MSRSPRTMRHVSDGRTVRRWVAVCGLVAMLGVSACGVGGEPARPVAAAGTTAETAPTSSAAPTTTTTAPPEEEAVTLAFTGDLLPHTAVDDVARANGVASGAAYDFRPMFSQVTPLLERPDLAICHLEVPLSADNALIAGYPTFSAPHELAPAIAAAGYDGCSTASNHTLDQRADGVVATLDALDANHVGHAGSARSAEEADRPVLYETDGGVVVGHVSAAYGFNGAVPDTPWRVRNLDPSALIAAGEAARDAGADLVVASLHWGLELQHEPTAEQLTLADQLTASGAFDLIVGHHAHVVQPVRIVNGVPVVFGLGNFVSNMTGPETRDGVIARVRATRDSSEGDAAGPWQFHIAVTPTYVDLASFTIHPIVASLEQPDGSVSDDELRASWQRTVSVMTADGVARPGPPLP